MTRIRTSLARAAPSGWTEHQITMRTEQAEREVWFAKRKATIDITDERIPTQLRLLAEAWMIGRFGKRERLP